MRTLVNACKRLNMSTLERLRGQKLQPLSVQHVLSALQRLQGRISHESIIESLSQVEKHIERIGWVESTQRDAFTPVQAMSSLAAMAKLQHRDLVAASILTSVLCGRWSR